MIKDNAEKNRVEIWADDKLAGLVEYHDHENTRALLHTEIKPEFEGRGLASELIRHVLDESCSSDRVVLPYCPFVRSYIAKHAEDYLVLVPHGRRKEFDLPG